MTVTRLSGLFVPAIYDNYQAVNNPEKSAFVQAGIVVQSPLLNEIAKAGGKTVEVPFWQDLDPSVEPNYSNDDPADLAVANAVTASTMKARKTWVNQSYGDMDLVQEVIGSSPMQQIKNRFGTYWLRQWQRRLIASCVGVLADNVANDSGDMQIDISAQTGDDAKFGSDAFVDAVYTLGDNADNLRGVAVHSQIMSRMVKNDDIVTVKDSVTGLSVQTYKDKVVIVDDNMPTTGSGANTVYTSILFGGGAIGFGGGDGHSFAAGSGIPRVASEVLRTPQAGNGGGMEEIIERKTWMLHPFGFEWIEGSLTEFSPQLSDLRLAAHWNRVVSRKQVPLAFLKSKA